MTHISPSEAHTIAAQVLSRRQSLRLTLNELAKATGIARATLHDIEKGRARGMRLGTLLRLADALACPPDALLGRDLGQPRVSAREMALIAAHRTIFPEVVAT